MKLHILSDLHINFQSFDIPEIERDVLVLAGDIGEYYDAPHFINQYQHSNCIVYVPGNHDYYGCPDMDITDAIGEAYTYDKTKKQEYNYLYQKRVQEVHGVRIAGCTLWTSFWNNPLYAEQARRAISDFYYITKSGEKFNPTTCAELCKNHADWLRKQKGIDVVVTHFPPSLQAIHPDYKGDALNPYFVNDMEDLVRSINAKLWIFGHTHKKMDFTVGNTRLVSNPRGYPGEKTGFDPSFVVEI